ncbi:MAG: hypothetical protein A3I89_00050 [Candidatus Harrisonbacteria bacterium RIFCSPLOWO2_02_FULL_41_11]|uniref:nicotinamidase n=1 Tax=Candidatus Harrisonbacteria bacterium RIFCSPHIGHO2_02_FULL_42_16 TaxID=1798404 RepID=A0A1G1ZFR1_9BACT|nr:MAG: hypothetical protein A3B92_03495 [Candidatus Harrisonbacteria bacterium RIFCSPHIGHO2_02_FULL_42_16]OGY66802.1 MAG: hypothetical protein A3I89_00050 [Candidatus Harrisonbacteria bacterium RIFCSPLOWO2_02_FULL_41_11]
MKKEKTALIKVDPQKDFYHRRGSLMVKGGDEVVEPLNDLDRQVDLSVVTRDWHKLGSVHFAKNRNDGKGWVIHCVENTWGAEFHPDLNLKNVTVFSKGMDPKDDGGYSGFEGVNENGTKLGDFLKKQGVTTVVVGGLATDYCVKATVLDALKLGFKVVVAYHAIRAVNLQPDNGKKAVKEMKKAGAIFVTTDDFSDALQKDLE